LRELLQILSVWYLDEELYNREAIGQGMIGFSIDTTTSSSFKIQRIENENSLLEQYESLPFKKFQAIMYRWRLKIYHVSNNYLLIIIIIIIIIIIFGGFSIHPLVFCYYIYLLHFQRRYVILGHKYFFKFWISCFYS